MTIGFAAGSFFSFLQCAIMLIQNKIGLTLMEYAIYFALSSLLLGCIFYVGRKIVKRIGDNKAACAVSAIPSTDDASDDFICLLKSDGTSVVNCGGVTVVGRRI